MEDTARELVVSVVAEHAESLLRVARRYAGCAADAEDAYQRALEIFVRNASRLDPETAHKWLHTVCKHEALEVRRQRAKLVCVDEERVLDALDDGRHLASVEERSERFEELTRAAEALRRCKPQEVTALVLKAQGLSYNEIAEREGWTYTKVNRCLTEGRRSFLSRFAGIESGAECQRWAPVLSAMADGEASAQDVLEVRPHLRNCAACRTLLGEMRRAPAAAASLLPVGGGGLLARVLDLVVGAFGASKVAAVGASVALVGGGGLAVVQGSASSEAPAVSRAVSRPVARAFSPVVAPPDRVSSRSSPEDGESPARPVRRSRPARPPVVAAPPVAAPPPASASAPPAPAPPPSPPSSASEFGFEPGR